jgi:CheY-like chemotaxis protein
MLNTVIVVEDTSNERIAAQKMLEGKGILCAATQNLEGFNELLKEIIKLLESGRRRKNEVGVLTDLFFPADWEDPSERNKEIAPLGMVVMMECRRLGIPCVIVTSEDHHAGKIDQVYKAGKVMGWPAMADKLPRDKGKPWDLGLKILTKEAG